MVRIAAHLLNKKSLFAMDRSVGSARLRARLKRQAILLGCALSGFKHMSRMACGLRSTAGAGNFRSFFRRVQFGFSELYFKFVTIPCSDQASIQADRIYSLYIIGVTESSLFFSLRNNAVHGSRNADNQK